MVIPVFANRHRFMMASKWLAPACYGAALIFIGFSLYKGLYMSLPQSGGGDSVRNLIMHVPLAYTCLLGYGALVLASLIWWVSRNDLADMAARAVVPIAVVYTALCLVTGVLWGWPAAGITFLWAEAYMLAALIQLGLLAGYRALRHATGSSQQAIKLGAMLAVAGALNLPLVRLAMAYVGSEVPGPNAAHILAAAEMSEYVAPLASGVIGHGLLLIGLTITVMRTEVWWRRATRLRAYKQTAGAAS